MIPPFNHNNVLPPYYGVNPGNLDEQSPYKCTIMEFCQRFAISNKRKKILRGFIQFRLKCNAMGITERFQWIDGSFIEDIIASKLMHSGMSEDFDTANITELAQRFTNQQCKMPLLKHIISNSNGNKRELIELLSISEIEV